MSVSQIIVFIIGAVLALFGLFMTITHFGDWLMMLAGVICIVIGVALLVNRTITL